MTDTIEQMAELLLDAKTEDEIAWVFEQSKLPEADKWAAFDLAKQLRQARDDAFKRQHAERMRLFDGLPEKKQRTERRCGSRRGTAIRWHRKFLASGKGNQK